MTTPKYLDISDLLAVERIAKVVSAHTLIDADLSERAGKSLRDRARAVRLLVEVRAYPEAVKVAQELREALREHGYVTRVLDQSITTLGRHL